MKRQERYSEFNFQKRCSEFNFQKLDGWFLRIKPSQVEHPIIPVSFQCAWRYDHLASPWNTKTIAMHLPL